MAIDHDLDAQQSGGLLSVWLSPRADGVQPSIYLEVLGCGKRYVRIWLENDEQIDYEWHLYHNAICLWQI